MSRQPLYPHVPKSRRVLPPPWKWREGERAILLDTPDLRTDDMSNVYVVELMRAPTPYEIGAPVKIVDIISITRDDIKPGIIIVANVYALFRSFRELVEGRPTRLAWLRAQGIDLDASVYHYRPWEAGDMAVYISRALGEVAAVEIQEINNITSVEVVKVALGRLDVGDVIHIPALSLFRSFHHYVTEHPHATQWLLEQRIREHLEED